MENSILQFLVVFICGILSRPLFRKASAKLLRSPLATGDGCSSIYGLEHGVFNLELPLSMWMNVGYWNDQINCPRDFAQACKALLETVLHSAFHCSDFKGRVPEKICLVDVGFGCGDQTLTLLQPTYSEEVVSNKLNNTGLKAKWPEVEMYVGLTNNPTQYIHSRQRLESAGIFNAFQNEHHSDKLEKSCCEHAIYCEDAAIPSSWTPKVLESIERIRRQSMSPNGQPVWLLALDTMYHFKPSRLPLLKYASAELNASFMAFDFMLADDEKAPTALQRLLLRLICLLTSAPYSNFLTQKEYRQMLLEVGYASENIEIKDIAEYVFKPLSEYMAWKDAQLRSIGLGIGAFQVARWIFSWWGRTGVVRGCIVVARHG